MKNFEVACRNCTEWNFPKNLIVRIDSWGTCYMVGRKKTVGKRVFSKYPVDTMQNFFCANFELDVERNKKKCSCD